MDENEFRRYFDLEINEIRQRERTIVATASTETPVDRGGFYEILSHANGAIDFSRFPLPLVDNHKSADMPAFGRATNPRVVNRKLKVDLVFGQSALAKERWQDVKDGIARHLSVGYIVKKKSQIRDDMTYTVERWEPLELSIVPTPANVNAVIGRSKQNDRTEEFKNYFSVSKGNRKMTRKEIKEKQDRELQEKIDRNNRFWLGDQEFKSLAEQLQALRAFAEVGLEDDRIKRASGSSLIDEPALQEEFNDKLFQAGNVSELWIRGFTIPIKIGSRLYLPTWDEKTRENRSLLGGMDYRWVEEGGTFDYSHPKYRALDMNLWKLMGLFPFSSELGDEPGFQKIMDVTATKGLNYMIEDALIRGTGSGRPQGLIHSNCKIRVSKESGQNADTIVAENIFNMASRIIPECFTNGDLVWIAHPSTLTQVSALTQSVGTGGSVNPLWHWRQGGERHNKLMGFDYIISDRCSVLGDEGDIILADLKSVVITYKPAKRLTSAHVGALFLADEEFFRLTMRMNCQNILSNPITPAQGSDTLSTVLTLENRA